MLDWVGIGIIVGVQVATSLYTPRRLDAMQKEISEIKSEMKERLGRLEGVLIGRQEVTNGALGQTGDD